MDNHRLLFEKHIYSEEFMEFIDEIIKSVKHTEEIEDYLS
jgi:hypothetical protein